jgi:tetratricopeptide (TPR) repeat protein
MNKADVERVIERARELRPGVSPRIISDNDPRFVAADLKAYIHCTGATHVRTCPYNPQANGILERLHKPIKGDAIRPKATSTAEEARRVVTAFVHHYKTEPLHTAIDYFTPTDRLAGRLIAITAERDRRLEAARERRAQWRQTAQGTAPSLPSSPAPLDSQPLVRYAPTGGRDPRWASTLLGCLPKSSGQSASPPRADHWRVRPPVKHLRGADAMQNIVDLFERHRLTAYLAAFESHHVQVADLEHLTDEDLRLDFQMSSYIDRKRYRAMVSELKGAVTTPPLPPLPHDDLPFPVAHPLAFARDPALGPTERLNNAIFAAYQAMRTTALLLLADYLDVAASDRALEGAIRSLRMPHWGEWTDLANKLVLFWSDRLDGKPERPTRFPALVEGWRLGAMKRDGDALLMGLPGMQGPARNLNDALWKLRNDRAHRMGTHTPARDDEEQHLARVLPIVDALCTALFPTGAFTLVRRVSTEPLQVVRVHGPHPTLEFVPEPLGSEWAGAFASTGVAALVGEEALGVYPLFAPDDEAPPGRRPEVVTLVDGVKRRSLVLLGVQSHAESERHLHPLMEALARKQVELGLGREQTKRWTLADWSRTLAREKVAGLLGVKYFPECYLERDGVDLYATRAMERGGRAMLLLGEAGSGKSSMLTRLVDRLTAEETPPPHETRSTLDAHHSTRGGGDIVLYLTGREAYAEDAGATGTQVLTEAVLRQAGIRSGTFRDLGELFAKLEESSAEDSLRDRRLWLVLDAINECDRFADLVTALDKVLPAVAKYPWLRLVMSCRTGAWTSLARRARDASRFGEVFTQESHLARFVDPFSQRDEPWMNVRPFDPKREGPEAYRLRAEARPAQACTTPWSKLSKTVRELLLNPLHLDIFHKAYAGRTDIGEDLDAGELLSAYLDRLAEEMPALEESLARVGDHLLANRTPALPAEVVDGWLAGWRAQQGYASAMVVVKLDPIEELVSASILMRPANEGFGVDRRLVAFTFTHQRLCEQVLARAIQRRIAPRSELAPADLAVFVAEAEASAGFVEYTGALGTLLVRAARAGRGALVASLLDLPEKATRKRLVGTVLRALARTWEAAGTQASWGALTQRTGVGENQRLRWLADSDLVWQLESRGWTAMALALAEARLAATREDAEATAEDLLARVEALMGVADLLGEVGESGRAQELNERAFAVTGRWVEAEPGRVDLQRALGRVQVNLGDHAQQKGRSTEARRYFEESLGIARRLSEAEPEREILSRDLLFSLNRLGDLAQQEGRSVEARRYFEDAFAIQQRLSEAEPERADFAWQLSHSFNLLGDLAQQEGRSVEARRYFEDTLVIRRRLSEAEPARVDLASTLAFSLSLLGDLAEQEGRSVEARRYLEDALAIRQRLSKAEPERADLASDLSVSLSLLGDLAEQEGRSVEARRYLEDALAIRQRLSEAEPERADFARDLSVSLRRFGDLAEQEGRSVEARRYFEECLAIRRRLSEAEPQRADLASDLSVSLRSLGHIAQNEGRSVEARRYLEDALAIRRRLSEAEPQRADFASDLSVSLNGLGDIAQKEGRTVEAHRYFEECLAIGQRLSKAEPARADLARNLSVHLTSVGDLAWQDGRSDEARRYFENSLAIRRRLSQAEPERTDLASDLSVSLRRLGEIAQKDGRTVEARRYFEECLAIRRRLSQAEPERTDLASDLSVSLRSLGEIAQNEGRTVEARRYLEDALAIGQRLSTAEPERADLARNLSVHLTSVGDLARQDGRSDEARRYFEDSLAIRRRLSKAEPEHAVLAWDLSVSIERLGDLAQQEGRSVEAQRYFEECLAIQRRLSEAEPAHADLARDLSVSFERLGDLAQQEGRSVEAQRYFEDALAIVRRLCEAQPERADLARDLSVSFERLGDLAHHEGRSAEARQYFEECLAIRRRLSEAEPERADLAHDLSVSLSRLGDLEEQEGRSVEARRYFEECLAIVRRLSAAEPERADLAHDLSVFLNRLADFAEQEGRSDEARRYFEEDLEIARRLSEAEPGRADLAWDLSICLNMLGDLAQQQGRSVDARRYFEEDLANARRLSEAEPERADLARDLSVSLNKLGGLAQQEDRSDDAQRYLEECLAIRRRLSEAEPQRENLARDLSVLLKTLGGLAKKEGRSDDARRYFEDALAIDRRLREAAPARGGA